MAFPYPGPLPHDDGDGGQVAGQSEIRFIDGMLMATGILL